MRTSGVWLLLVLVLPLLLGQICAEVAASSTPTNIPDSVWHVYFELPSCETSLASYFQSSNSLGLYVTSKLSLLQRPYALPNSVKPLHNRCFWRMAVESAWLQGGTADAGGAVSDQSGASASRLLDLRVERSQLQWARLQGTAADMYEYGLDVLRLSSQEWIVFHAGVFHQAQPLLWQLLPMKNEVEVEATALETQSKGDTDAAAAAIAAVSSSSSVASAPSYSSVCPRCGLHPSAVLSHGSVLNLQRGYLHRCFCVPAPVPPVEQQRTMYLVLDSCNRKGIVAKVAMAGRPNQPVEGFILADAPDTLKKYYKQQQAIFPSDRSPSPSSSLPSVFPGVPGVLCMSSVWLGRPLSASVHTRELQHLLGRSEELLMLGYHSIHYDQLGQVFKVFNEQQIHNIATAAEAEAEAPGETHH